jgi:hypothetical protein
MLLVHLLVFSWTKLSVLFSKMYCRDLRVVLPCYVSDAWKVYLLWVVLFPVCYSIRTQKTKPVHYPRLCGSGTCACDSSMPSARHAHGVLSRGKWWRVALAHCVHLQGADDPKRVTVVPGVASWKSVGRQLCALIKWNIFPCLIAPSACSSSCSGSFSVACEEHRSLSVSCACNVPENYIKLMRAVLWPHVSVVFLFVCHPYLLYHWH